MNSRFLWNQNDCEFYSSSRDGKMRSPTTHSRPCEQPFSFLIIIIIIIISVQVQLYNLFP
jgi:hypothetical protein